MGRAAIGHFLIYVECSRYRDKSLAHCISPSSTGILLRKGSQRIICGGFAFQKNGKERLRLRCAFTANGYICANFGSVLQVRLSQGLLYLGKGLLHLGALHSDRQVICRVALGALAIVSYSAFLMRHTILGLAQLLKCARPILVFCHCSKLCANEYICTVYICIVLSKIRSGVSEGSTTICICGAHRFKDISRT